MHTDKWKLSAFIGVPAQERVKSFLQFSTKMEHHLASLNLLKHLPIEKQEDAFLDFLDHSINNDRENYSLTKITGILLNTIEETTGFAEGTPFPAFRELKTEQRVGHTLAALTAKKRAKAALYPRVDKKEKPSAVGKLES